YKQYLALSEVGRAAADTARRARQRITYLRLYKAALVITRLKLSAEELAWREQGWVTADTHVHFLSPTTALLEGQAEGVHVVNLLASQWGEMFSNVSDFDGRTTLGA